MQSYFGLTSIFLKLKQQFCIPLRNELLLIISKEQGAAKIFLTFFWNLLIYLLWWSTFDGHYYFCLFYFLTPISRGRYLIPLTCRANGELKRTQQKQCAITLWFFAEHGSWYDKIESDHTYTLYNSIIKFRIIRKITSYQIRNKLYVSTREQGGKYNAILDNMFPK